MTTRNLTVVQNDIYEISQLNITFESCGYSLYGEIYYPTNKTDRFPGIVFCEGGGGYVSAYSWIPKALAKQGYVTFIFDFPGQGKSEGILPSYAIDIPRLNLFLRFGASLEATIHSRMGIWMKVTKDAITFLISENPVNYLVNSSNIGLIGHSLGGFAVTGSAAQQENIKAIVALSHAHTQLIDELTVPVQFQCGDLDIKTKSIFSVLESYKKANSPKELIAISGGTHAGFTTVLGSFCPCPSWQKDICLRFATAWFDYFLKHDIAAYYIITSGCDHLSTIIASRYNFGEGEYILSIPQ
ncbi:MAG: alpha/beta fold hydrolase [Candidatus Thermoplasmatota archaeon]|nr:alpha/beta fold hydrolase [Candidatus Thermoplasmatota archaeon]